MSHIDILMCLYSDVYASLSTPQTVTSSNEALKSRVKSVVQIALMTISSLAEIYGGAKDTLEEGGLGHDLSDARFLDDEEGMKDEADESMKVEA